MLLCEIYVRISVVGRYMELQESDRGEVDGGYDNVWGGDAVGKSVNAAGGRTHFYLASSYPCSLDFHHYDSNSSCIISFEAL